MIAADAEHRCAFSIFGEDEHPHNTRRPAQVLRFAGAYLELLERFAADRDEPIEFEGIALTDNCITAETRVSNPVAGMRASLIANQAIKDPEAYRPQGAGALITTCRDLGRGFGVPVQIRIGPTFTELVEYQASEVGRPWSITTLRARLIRVGIKPPAIRLEPVLRGSDFSAKVNPAQVEGLLPCMGKELDVEILAARDARGRIERAEVLRFWPIDTDLDAEAVLAQWTDWYASVTREEEQG